jgi:hypothetical protein
MSTSYVPAIASPPTQVLMDAALAEKLLPPRLLAPNIDDGDFYRPGNSGGKFCKFLTVF